MALRIVFLLFAFASCMTPCHRNWPKTTALSGSAYYQLAAGYGWKQRDSLSLNTVLSGNMPDFLKRFVPIHISQKDSNSGKTIRLTYFVSPDYLSVGTRHDWARIHVTPQTAQRIADSLHCVLPTRKMVDQIYTKAVVKLPPVPMYALRDSTPTFYHHHLIVEGQRQGRKGLIAGIQKDVVTTGKLSPFPKQDRVAIYGWHKPDGKPIQPLYTGHVYWYVDYSQGIRLVHNQVRVNGRWMLFYDVIKDSTLKQLISSEAEPGSGRYETLN